MSPRIIFDGKHFVCTSFDAGWCVEDTMGECVGSAKCPLVKDQLDKLSEFMHMKYEGEDMQPTIAERLEIEDGLRTFADPSWADKVRSDGSTASYYELPKGASELQDLISYKNMNAQIGEIFRACYRYGQVEHSEMLRDAKKMKFYAEAEIDRLTKYKDNE